MGTWEHDYDVCVNWCASTQYSPKPTMSMTVWDVLLEAVRKIEKTLMIQIHQFKEVTK